MGTTATKLEYLNDTKGLLKDSINSLGGNITSQTTFRQYATELDSIYSNLPKVSETGSNISLTPTLKGRLGSTLKGNTLQDGTPSPSSPVEIQSATGLQNINVCGKNLFDKNSAEVGKFVNASGVIASDNSALVSDFIRITPNINYYISGRTSWNSIGLYNSNKTFLERINLNYTNGILNITNSNCAYIRINASSDNFNTLQLEVGSTATTYEEYQSQTKELNLGKNLFDGDFETGGYDTGNGQKGASNDRIRCINYIKVEPNTTYTFSFENDGSAYFLEYDNSKTYLNKYTLIMYHTKSGTITTSSNTKYITFYYIPYNHTLIIDEQCQLEKGSQATSYSPYFTPIHLYENDQIIGTPDNWSIVRVNGELTLNGSENLENWTSGTNTIGFKLTNVSNLKNIESSSTENIIISNYFTKSASQNALTSNDVEGFATTGGNLYFKINKTTANSLASFKTWLSTHNTIVDYVLATETTTPITNQEIINQLNEIYYLQSYNGTTNITITSEDLEMIMTASALKGEE